MGKCKNVFMERCEKGRGAARHALAASRITRRVFVIYDLTIYYLRFFVLCLLLGGNGIATDGTGDTDGTDEEAREPPDTEGQKGHGAWGMLRVVCGGRCCWVNLVIELVKEFVDECQDEL